MTIKTVLANLKATNIRLYEDYAVAVAGKTVPLPYIVASQDTVVTGSDNGAVQLLQTDWTVDLFTKDQAPDLELKILRALVRAGEIQIARNVIGEVYVTSFTFTTYQAIS